MRRRAMFLAPLLLAGVPASAQTVSDGSDAGMGPEAARAAVALLGRGLAQPGTARISDLRPGRSGALCGRVDQRNRMGDDTGPRGFVADPGAGFAGVVPDGPELRHPASPAHYAAMQRARTLYAENCLTP